MKMKIEKSEVLHGPILTSYLVSVPNFRKESFSIKQFELQTPISQLFNALKSHIFACELFTDRLF